MDSIAILLEKVSLEQQRFIFKPTRIVKGVWDKEENTFLTTDGDYYDLLVGGDPCKNYFCDVQTTIQELKKTFGSDSTEDELLKSYFNLCIDYLYVGYYDENTKGLNIKRIPFDSIVESIEQGKQIKDLAVNGEYYIFERQVLEDIRNLPESEIKDKINEIISVLDNEDVKEYPNIIPNSKTNQKLVTLKKLRREVLSKIVGQDSAVNDITRGIMINQTSSNPNNKSHMLVTGPTGTGKTEIVKIVCDALNLPFFEADATAYTKEGYVGKSVYSMLDGLIAAADGDIEAAQNGILVIDEIDKKVYGRSADDVGGKDVLYSLLKIMDRGIIELNNKNFDTSDLTIICMGAFEEFYQKKLKDNNKIGFGQSTSINQVRNIVLSKEDLIKGGVPSEFLGRIGDVTSTIPFDEATLIHLLYKSKLSALKLQKEYFKEAFDVDLINTYGYAKEIAKQALKAKTNARELKPLIRTSLKYATDEFLSGKRAKVLKINKETALDPKKYYIE